MYSYFFQFADLLIQIEVPFTFDTFYEMDCYRISNEEKKNADVIYRLSILPEEWEIRGRLLYDGRKSRIYQVGNRIYRYFFWNVYTEKKYIVLSYTETDYTYFDIYIQKGSMEELLKEFHFSALLAIELVLLKNKAFQLHSSIVEWNRKGILFTAPSGTGKSTQAELWKKYEQATIINGDKALIRKIDDKFIAYGSPYAGTSNIYTNFSVPVCAIVVLEQGTGNALEIMNPLLAFTKLYSESTVNAWNSDFVNEFMNLLYNLVETVPVYHFSCRPDQEAVSVVKKAILSL